MKCHDNTIEENTAACSAIDEQYLGLQNNLEMSFDFDPATFVPSFEQIYK